MKQQSGLTSFAPTRNSVALKEQLLQRLKQSTQKCGKSKFTEIFMSNKGHKPLVLAFSTQYQQEMALLGNQKAQQEFRENFFKESLLNNLAAKQYKRRKNAFYILAHLIESDPFFIQVALRCFHKIKDILFTSDQLPDLTSLEVTTDYLKFKIYVNNKVHDWTERHSSEFPDLYIWKKAQSQFFQGNPEANSELFTEKFQQLRIYKVIYERNKGEMDILKDEFMKIRFECIEAKRLMEEDIIIDEKEEIKQAPIQYEINQVDCKESDLDENLAADELNFLQDMMGQESTQIDAPAQKMTKEDQPINIEQTLKAERQYIANSKNLTLFRVLSDNRKSLERRVIPLLEMFRVETAFFKNIQATCLGIVADKKQHEAQYGGKIKITKKDVQEFEEAFVSVSDEDLASLMQQVEQILKSVHTLKQDLELIKLKQEISGITGKYTLQIMDEDDEKLIRDEEEEEDPDAHLFR